MAVFGYNAAAVLNAPLGDKAAIRIDGFYRKDHGYVDSIGNNPILDILTGRNRSIARCQGYQ